MAENACPDRLQWREQLGTRKSTTSNLPFSACLAAALLSRAVVCQTFVLD